jgi:hypothetical protein
MSIEKFEDRRLRGAISVVCKLDDGSIRRWTTKKETVVEQIVEIVDYFSSLGHKLTLRQLHYQFVSRNWIVNHITAYKKLGKILDDCRYGGIIDWDAIEDRGRSTQVAYYEHGIPEALKRTVDAYRLDRQLGQENHVEVWTEKDALSAILGKVTRKYGIGLAVNKGYTSSSAIYDAYERFCYKINEGRRVTILYFGDHDPSGLDMIRDVRERLEFMFGNGQGIYNGGWSYMFRVHPIGLTMKQIKKYNLPPNPAKTTDSRSAAYIQEFGQESWEVDALNPVDLVKIVEDNILDNIDIETYNEVLAQEEKDIAVLNKFIKTRK